MAGVRACATAPWSPFNLWCRMDPETPLVVSPRRKLLRTRPAPPDIAARFQEAYTVNPRFKRIVVRGMELAMVPLANQHELSAQLYVFEDGGMALGREYGFKHGAVLLHDGCSLEVRKVSKRPSDGYLMVTIPREADPRHPFPLRLHHAVAAAFSGIPRVPGLVVRHRHDRRDRNGAADLIYGTPAENRADYIANKRRSRARSRVVLIKACTARKAATMLGTKGERLNRLVDRLLKKYLSSKHRATA